MAHRTVSRGGGRKRGRVAATATALALGIVVPPSHADPSPQPQDIKAELGYTCALPDGSTGPAQIRVSTTLPSTAAVGETVQPSVVAVVVEMPAGSVTPLLGDDARAVTASTSLTIALAQSRHRAEAVWTGTGQAPAPVPDAGPLTVTTSGEVPSVTAGSPGDLTFSAAGLSLRLTPLTGEDGQQADSPVTLNCTPEEPSPELATVTVEETTAPSTGPSGPPTAPSVTTGSTPPSAPPSPQPREQEGTAAAQAAAAPPCAGDRNVPQYLVAYATGFSNVTKLKGAAEIPVSCARIIQGPQRPVFMNGKLHLLQDSFATLDHEGRPRTPPVEATFLGFGFMPTTATMQLEQMPLRTDDQGNPVANVKSDLRIDNAFDGVGQTVITMDLVVHITKVMVNGQALDVGARCRTRTPFTLTLTGNAVRRGGVFLPGSYTLVTGGPLTGEATIPAFSGCGAAEDLDPLFTASISGSPGYVKQIQGAPCASGVPVPDSRFCTPDVQPVDIPEPQR
ncbi:DUF6801 domain-containing protein [Streptomyces formicae]|uniref:DUF6801 domain-containing protein n=1 Tax=Streptomyces formicae TaxID=1616117 RepID=A0ABY3WK85_9ACTN|nr:DUF6801 domain-containing protein [Streptomyces formicae]UNM12535.1 hypothetical protein J4032_14230 [Streptomyces formicae]